MIGQRVRGRRLQEFRGRQRKNRFAVAVELYFIGGIFGEKVGCGAVPGHSFRNDDGIGGGRRGLRRDAYRVGDGQRPGNFYYRVLFQVDVGGFAIGGIPGDVRGTGERKNAVGVDHDAAAVRFRRVIVDTAARHGKQALAAHIRRGDAAAALRDVARDCAAAHRENVVVGHAAALAKSGVVIGDCAAAHCRYALLAVEQARAEQGVVVDDSAA